MGSDEEMRGTRLTRGLGAVTRAVGTVPAIIAAAGLIVIWVVGLFFVPKGFANNTYQLVINTVTTIVTFLMVFVIQNVQNRESEATQTKLDALMEALMDIAEDRGVDLTGTPLADLVGLEEGEEKDIRRMQEAVRRERSIAGRGRT